MNNVANVIEIANTNPNTLAVILIIIAATYILYAIIGISLNNARKKKLTHVKKLIEGRHRTIEYENEKRRKNREQMERMGM